MKKIRRKEMYLFWRKQGLSYREIGAKYGVSWQAVHNSVTYVYKHKSKQTYRKVGLQSKSD